jgi:hypothetical protein
MDQKTLDDLLKKYPTAVQGDDGLTVITCVARLAYVHFDKPHAPKGTNKEARYSCAVIIPPNADWSPLKEAAKKAWAESPLRAQTPKTLPFKEQKEQFAKKRDGFAETGIFFNCETKNPVDLFGADMQRIPVDQAYSGMWARVKVRASAYDVSGNNGIKFWVQAVQKIADDEKFSGGSSEDGFEAVNAPAGSGPAKVPANSASSVW